MKCRHFPHTGYTNKSFICFGHKCAFSREPEFRSFLGPHHDWLLQPEPIHMITLLAVRLHGDHETAASRIDTQPDSLFQLRGVGDTTRHQPLTGNFEDFVTRLSVGFLQQRFQIALIKALEQHTPTTPRSWPPPSPSDPWTAGRKI